jgi:drug/metabolite transporter (DMT)-like permease
VSGAPAQSAHISPAAPARDRVGAHDRLAYLAAIVATFGWGSLYPAAKLALVHVTPLHIALARAVIAALVLGLLATVAGGRRALYDEWRARPGALVILGTISFVGTSLLAMAAQRLLPAAVNGLLNNTAALWLALGAAVLGRARNGPLLVLGSAIALAGVALVLLPGAGPAPFGAAPLDWRGVVLSLAGSALIAVSNVVARRTLRGANVLAATALAAGWATLPLLAITLVVDGLEPIWNAPVITQALLLYLGTACTALNFALWFFALSRVPVTRVSNLQYLIPPLGVVLSVLLLGEPATPGLLAGTVAILVGIVLAQRGAEA